MNSNSDTEDAWLSDALNHVYAWELTIWKLFQHPNQILHTSWGPSLQEAGTYQANLLRANAALRLGRYSEGTRAVLGRVGRVYLRRCEYASGGTEIIPLLSSIGHTDLDRDEWVQFHVEYSLLVVGMLHHTLRHTALMEPEEVAEANLFIAALLDSYGQEGLPATHGFDQDIDNQTQAQLLQVACINEWIQHNPGAAPTFLKAAEDLVIREASFGPWRNPWIEVAGKVAPVGTLSELGDVCLQCLAIARSTNSMPDT